MRQVFALGLLFFLTIGTAQADVSHELIVGWDHYSSTEITATLVGGGMMIDLADTGKSRQDEFTASYVHFFKALTDDNSPVELRRFFQHPSTLLIGLTAANGSGFKLTTPDPYGADEWRAAGVSIAAEHFLLTDTGVLLELGGSSATDEFASFAPEDSRAISYRLGVRQYLAKNVELHLELQGVDGERKTTYGTMTTDRKIVLLGGRWIIGNIVGLSLDIGRGSRKDDPGDSAAERYDISQASAEIALYAGRQLSFRLAAEHETEDAPLSPAGFEQRRAFERATIAVKYWFGEQWALEVPFHAATSEYMGEAIVSASGTGPIGTFGHATSTRSKGAGLSVSYRF